MTRKQLDEIMRALERVRKETVSLEQQLDDYPEIAEYVDEAADHLLAALEKLEAERDDLDAIVPDEADRVL